MRNLNGSPCVLVVDDNLDAANSLAMILRAHGHDDVHIACDGHSAVHLAARLRPQLVFLDIGLPGLDGFAVAKRLREEPSLAGLKIIVVTGRAGEDDRHRCLEAGIHHYLVKPMDPAFVASLLGASGKRKGP